MSGNNILVTGVSGYLGGTLLHRLKQAELPAYNTLYALVRTESQAQAVKQYGAEPLNFDSYDIEEVKEAVLKYEINIVFALHDAIKPEARVNFIKALSSLKEKSGIGVHLLHVRQVPFCLGAAILMTPRPAEPNQSHRTLMPPSTNPSRILVRLSTRFRSTQTLEARCCLKYVSPRS